MLALRTGVSAPQALVLIIGLVGGGSVSGVCHVCVTIAVVPIQFPAANHRRNETKHTSSNFRAKTVQFEKFFHGQISQG